MNRVKWAVLQLAAAAAAALPAIRACAYTQVVDGIEWSYVLNAGSAAVFDPSYKAAIPTSTSGAITVPSKLGDSPVPVTDIGDLAFAACGGLAEVTIPDGVKGIGKGAFALCKGLTGVIIPAR